MIEAWHWFVIAGTLISLAAMLWLLFANRATSGNETTGHNWDGIEELDSPLPMWWVWMFVTTIVFALGYLVYYPGLGNVEGVGNWTSTNQHDAEVADETARYEPLYAQLGDMSSEELRQNKQAMQVGRRLFINNCSTCHGVNANGSPGFPNLTDEQWLWGSDFAAIKTSIVQGRNAQMPPWGSALGEEGVTNVAHYVHQLAGREHDGEAATKGAQQFAMFCVACHGPEGKGNALFGAPDLTQDIWLYGGDLDTISATIRDGRAGVMPAHANLLSDDKAHILAAYVESLTK